MKLKHLLTPLAIAASLSTSAFAADTAKPMNAAEQKQIEDVVHNYLVKNPEVLVEALQALQQKQIDEARKTIQKTQETAPKFANELFHQANDPSTGNAKGKVTIVNFFDYQCPHCLHMTPILDAVMKADPEVRLVFKEFPIRGANSEFAAKAALAAKLQGKYLEFHKALMQDVTQQQLLTEDSVMKVAQAVGLNVDKLKTDMKSDAIAQQIKDNLKLGQNLQLLGTPAYFIAKTNVTTAGPITFVPGQMEQPQLEATIKKME